MTTLWQEEEILRDIVDGLNAAIDEEGWDHEELDPIKFNKLLYLAVDHFDLPITYRWYKYGSDFTPHGFSVDEDISPEPLAELPSPEEPRIEPSEIEDSIKPPSPSDVKSFYQEGVESIEQLFEDDTKEYLRSFYGDYAPSNLEGVYSTCAVLQKSLDTVGHAQSPGKAVEENLDTILDELNELTREVMFNDIIADAESSFLEYTEFLKDVLITVSDRDGSISPRREDVLRSVIKFFYRRAWKLVALKIASVETQGEHSLEWRQTAGNRFLMDYNNYDKELRALRHRCKRAGLIADDLLEYSQPVARQADQTGRAEREKEVTRRWEGVSLGVNKQL